ncbi:SusD-like starch-binding protein associating with outer membrane [Mucilaginibacter gracilis]|uniref:SusD-like starch-binding protein associating with outer membrane n=1 Tax=Mucilaginibacter gracilis TaxID=423350 RepID=A0A495IZ48_9SPHI|nr:SusD/RagB family nutrient-binding outer membrane lipoprotein [Mucilaginibacter gracilis]RKR81368.1 SusD-like starch-binding protein associating with outer membrane [Mucilaginibacter gracilis]
MKKIFIYTLTTALVWSVAGCQKLSDFGNTNYNQAAISTPIIGALLTNAELSVANYAGSQLEAINGGQYSQYFAETQYPAVSLYALPQYNFTGEYSTQLYDLQSIINAGTSKNTSNVALILQQYIFWHITDSWGDVPYSQALKGLAYPQPAYDAQQNIYKGMLSALTSAVSSFDGSAISGDIFYNGNVASWKKMANTLRMLISLQLSKKMPTSTDYAATQFNAALNDVGGSIVTNADNMKVVYPGGTYKDPFFSLYDGRTDYAESKTMTDLLSSLNDTRATIYGGAFNDPNNVTGGTISSNVGIPPGGDRTSTVAFTTANPSFALVLRADQRTPTSPLFVLTAGESLLARAHAAAIGWTTESAATLYASGVTQAFAQWGLTVPTSYISSAPVFADIIKQRYLASYPDGFMGWDIYRLTSTTRDGTAGSGSAFTQNPLNLKPGTGGAGKPIVSRFTYSASEYTTNTASVNAAIALISGGDKQDSRVWWDQ